MNSDNDCDIFSVFVRNATQQYHKLDQERDVKEEEEQFEGAWTFRPLIYTCYILSVTTGWNFITRKALSHYSLPTFCCLDDNFLSRVTNMVGRHLVSPQTFSSVLKDRVLFVNLAQKFTMPSVRSIDNSAGRSQINHYLKIT